MASAGINQLSFMDELIPTFPTALSDSVRITAVLPHILPKLRHLPLTAFNAHALGAAAEVAGPGLNSHLVQTSAREAAETVVLVTNEEGVVSLISDLVRAVGDSQLVDEASNKISTLIVLLSDSDSATVAVCATSISCSVIDSKYVTLSVIF
ncbi:eIF-2-alpha kinase activator GCN1 isoform X2 [Prunus yedoensis var. nudiflora]|uniref:eIF-2-alpha kinase activator GCN1 isoform X2 n=1 Tax=Prunus yedoensis var. nudiflora TaxID=2094558 RepID=A0A314YX96_PRUYE|nr:eIF-2-alpha kinase activator GCN1 isoform X2 [Prunus yedoensis var. nudiflora]